MKKPKEKQMPDKQNLPETENPETEDSLEQQNQQESDVETGKGGDEKRNTGNEKQFVVFLLENQEYGIDIAQVHEIDRLKEIVISPVPKTPEFVEGIINLRGDVVPIIDLRKKLGMVPKEIDKSSRILIVKLTKKVIGLLVDGVSEVISVYESSISPTPEEISDVETKFINSVARTSDKRLILLINIDEVLSLEESDVVENSVKGL